MYVIPAYTDISHFRAPYKDSLMGLGATASFATTTAQTSLPSASTTVAGRTSSAALVSRPTPAATGRSTDKLTDLESDLSAAANAVLLGADPRFWDDNIAALKAAAANAPLMISTDPSVSPYRAWLSRPAGKDKDAISYVTFAAYPTKTQLILDPRSAYHTKLQLAFVNAIALYGDAGAQQLRDAFLARLRGLAVFGGRNFWDTKDWVAVDDALTADLNAARKLAGSVSQVSFQRPKFGASSGSSAAATTAGGYVIPKEDAVRAPADVKAALAPPVELLASPPTVAAKAPAPVSAEKTEAKIPWPLVAAGAAAGAGVIWLATRRA